MNINDIIIIGGGLSIQDGIKLGLKEKIKNKFVFACNYAYKHFPYTAMLFLDKDFYVPKYAKRKEVQDKYPDIYNELSTLPLIISNNINNGISEFLHKNTFLIHYRTPTGERPVQTGIFALALAEQLKAKNIFLCGFDWTRQTIPEKKENYNPKSDLQIHYYPKKEINHNGFGFTGFYDRHNPDNYFKFYGYKDSKIYNVSLESNIQNFEKIDYSTMFDLLNKEQINQEELRIKIKNYVLQF